MINLFRRIYKKIEIYIFQKTAELYILRELKSKTGMTKKEFKAGREIFDIFSMKG